MTASLKIRMVQVSLENNKNHYDKRKSNKIKLNWNTYVKIKLKKEYILFTIFSIIYGESEINRYLNYWNIWHIRIYLTRKVVKSRIYFFKDN